MEKNTKTHTIGEWITAVRPWSFPASLMPVSVTLAYLFWKGFDINWLTGIWALVNIVVFHAAGNTWSDYFDFKKKIDREDTYGIKLLTSEQFQPKEIMTLSLVLLVIALLGGILLMCIAGIQLFYVGLGGLLCTLLYPPLKYRALGDLVIMLAYSILPTLGTSFVAIGEFDLSVLWIAVPVGLITVGILHANNTRDMKHDERACIKTFAMLLGSTGSIFAYIFEVLFPFAWVLMCVVFGILPIWVSMTFIALIPAMKNVKMVTSYSKEGMVAVANLDELTAKLQLIFSLLFVFSLIIAAFVE